MAGKRAELTTMDAQIEKMIQAIMDGFYSPAMKEKMPVLEARKAELMSKLEHATEPAALLHPAMGQEYRKRIDGLFEAFADEQTRLETSDDLRALIGRVVVAPGSGEDGSVVLRLEGDLGGIGWALENVREQLAPVVFSQYDLLIVGKVRVGDKKTLRVRRYLWPFFYSRSTRSGSGEEPFA